jgi:hypothetical protein
VRGEHVAEGLLPQGMPLIPGCWPGGTVGAGGALTPGVNRLPSVGLMLFSVAVGGAVVDGGDVVVVVVVVVEGAWLSLLHPAVTAPSTTRAIPPMRVIRRRPMRFELIVDVLSVSGLVIRRMVVARVQRLACHLFVVTVNPGWLSWCGWRFDLR